MMTGGVPQGAPPVGVVLLLVAPLVFRAPKAPAVGPGRCVCRRAAARPRDRHTRACGSEWSISRPALALRALRHPPHRRRLRCCVRWRAGSLSGQALRVPRRGLATLVGPAAAPIGCGLVCRYGSLFSNVACNSPPALCWFVSVCSVASLVFVNCMRLLASAGPAARRRSGQALRACSVLRIDETGCVPG